MASFAITLHLPRSCRVMIFGGSVTPSPHLPSRALARLQGMRNVKLHVPSSQRPSLNLKHFSAFIAIQTCCGRALRAETSRAVWRAFPDAGDHSIPGPRDRPDAAQLWPSGDSVAFRVSTWGFKAFVFLQALHASSALQAKRFGARSPGRCLFVAAAGWGGIRVHLGSQFRRSGRVRSQDRPAVLRQAKVLGCTAHQFQGSRPALNLDPSPHAGHDRFLHCRLLREGFAPQLLLLVGETA